MFKIKSIKLKQKTTVQNNKRKQKYKKIKELKENVSIPIIEK